MKIMNKQQGMSFFGLMMILGVGAFFLMLLLKIGPLYMEYGAVASGLDSLAGAPNIGKQGKRAMIRRLDGQFNIDDVAVITAKDIIFKKGKTVWFVTADYEARAPLFSNISAVAHFVKTVEVPRK